MRVCVNMFFSFLRSSICMGRRLCGSEKHLTSVSAWDLSVLSFLLEALLSLPIAKRLRFGLRMTTAVDCYWSVGSWQSVSQDEVGVGVYRGCVSFSYCFYVWWPMLKTHHVVVPWSWTPSETDCSIPRKWKQRAMIVSKTMKEFLTLCRIEPRWK